MKGQIEQWCRWYHLNFAKKFVGNINRIKRKMVSTVKTIGLALPLKLLICNFYNVSSIKLISGLNSFFNVFYAPSKLYPFFHTSLELKQCLKKVTNFGPLASNLLNLFSKKCSCFEKPTAGKNFLTAYLDNWINKILFLQFVCKRKVVFLGGNIRSKSVLFGLKVCQKAPSPVCLRKTEEPCCTMDEISKFCPKTSNSTTIWFKNYTTIVRKY